MAFHGEAQEVRYGSAQSDLLSEQIPETMRVIYGHRSTRKFCPNKPLPAGILEAFVTAGQSASTSSLLQTWSVIAVEDQDRKSKVATLAGDQQFIRDAPLFLLFCADLHRSTQISRANDKPGKALEMTDMLLMAIVDASLAAQNVSTLAESLGLGTCYVGAARNNASQMAELLHLPSRTFGVFGMAIGWPDLTQVPRIKPRLPRTAILHREVYNKDQASEIATYDYLLGVFYDEQGKTTRKPWSEFVAEWLATDLLDGRERLRQALRDQDFQAR